MEELSVALRALAGPRWRECRYLVAVSGGLDSMALWRAFRDLSLDHAVAHYNHRQRGPESDADETFVRFQALGAGIAAHTGRYPGGAASEDRLRRARRAFLEETRESIGARFIVTAHHGNDQLETLFLRLLRGTGLDGLGAMARRRGPWLRPWLEWSRAEIESWARARGVAFREDRTNCSPRFLRNRVRHSLAPGWRELAGAFGGEEASLRRVEETLREVRETASYLAAEAEARFARDAVVTPFWIRMPRTALLEPPPLLAARLVARAGACLGEPALTRPQRERALRGAERGQGVFNLGGDLDLEVSCDQLFFRRRSLPPPAPRLETAGDRLRCALLGWEARVDPRWLEGREPRFFRPGDRMSGVKLKELLLERRIPRPERPLVPLIADRDSPQVRWIFPDPTPSLRVESRAFPFSNC